MTQDENIEPDAEQLENEVVSEEIELSKKEQKDLILKEMRNEVSTDIFGVENSEDLSEEQLVIVNKLVSKMKKPRKSKAKKDKIPKRTAGRMIAPTLRVKDEDNILKSIYTMRGILEGEHFKGGWGEAQDLPKPTKIMTPILQDLVDGLTSIVLERHIADDTILVIVEPDE